ncbi:MAG: hypothetical protein WA061_02680 [Microgenomates group bacterium]
MEKQKQKENLYELYIDHLTTSLEKRSIGKILDFLSLYCGWEEIFSYVYDKVDIQREARGGIK